MDDDLRYRTELADQFLERLRAITPAEWQALVTHARRDDDYYALATELADEALRLFGDDRRGVYEEALQQRAVMAESIIAAAALDASFAAQARRLARGAVHAFLVRDAYGFNSGAFGELVRPFRAHLDLSDVERRASRSRTPPGGAPGHPPRDVPHADPTTR